MTISSICRVSHFMMFVDQIIILWQDASNLFTSLVVYISSYSGRMSKIIDDLINVVVN